MGKNRDHSKFPNAITVLDNGNVGIGVTNPGYKTSIANEMIVGGQGGSDFLYLSGGSGYGAKVRAYYATSSLNSELSGNGNTLLNLTVGNVGIGNSNPSYKLTLGTITGGGTATASPTCITMDETFGNNGLGSNFKLRLFQNSGTNTYGLGVSDSLLEVVAGATGSIGFFSNQSQLSMKISSAGQITKPYQPCFSAYGPESGASTRTTGAFTSFNLTRINRGGHYNTSTGRFTAPVAGAYEFIFSLLWRQSNDSAAGEISLAINGANVSSRGMAYTYAGAANDFHDQTFVRAIFNLSAGDYVTGWIHSSGSSTGNWYYGQQLAHFSGHLLG